MKKILLTVLFLCFTISYSQDARNGTSAASQLLVPQGGRHLSGGGAVATASGLEASYWNPAGLVNSANEVNAIFSRRSFIGDIGINFFGASLKVGETGSLGLTARTWDIGEINITDEFHPDGTGGQFSPSIFVIGASYSKKLTDRTNVGFGINYLNESFERVGASGISFDVGVQYSSFLNYDGLNIGVALRNFGMPMQYEGSGLFVSAEESGSNRQTDWYKIATASFDMPFLMDIGVSYSPIDNLQIGVTYEENNFGPNQILVLSEYDLGIGAVRLGYVSSEEQEDLENIFSGVSFGGSVNLSSLIGRDLALDYAFVPAKYFEPNQVFSLRFGF